IFYCPLLHGDLPPFPTRRSSDLQRETSASRSSLPCSTRRITPIATTSFEMEAIRTGSSAVTGRDAEMSASPFALTDTSPPALNSIRTAATGSGAAASRSAAAIMPAPSPGMEPACRLLQADADAGAELTAEHVRIGGVRRHAGFRHQQRPAVEQVGDVDEELRLVAAEAHRLR